MKKKMFCFVIACMMSFSVTACGTTGNKDEATTAPTVTSETIATSTPKGSEETTTTKATSDNSSAYDPFGKYAEPVTVTAVLSYAAKTDPNIPDATTPETQSFIKMAKEKLNIDVKFLWIAPSNQFEQKFGIAMASGDLPDILRLNATNFQLLKENDQLADLTEAYKYAGGKFKEYAEKDMTSLSFGQSDGKMYAIPQYSDVRRNMNLMFVRQDWLDKLNLSIPKTAEQLQQVATAFAQKDPDGNGTNDTTGIAVCKDVVSWGFDIGAVMNSFGSYPMKWIKGSDGKLIPGEIQPQTKDALEFLTKMYKDGAIDKEFILKDADKVAEDLIAGKAGIVYGPWWLYEWPLNMNKDNQPDANWVTTQIPGLTEGMGKSIANRVDISDFFAVNKNCKNPEAVIKLLNLYCDFSEHKYGEAATAKGGFVWNWSPVVYGDPFDIETGNILLNKAMQQKTAGESFSADVLDGKTPADVLKGLENFDAYNAYIAGTAKWDGAKCGTILARTTDDGGWGTTRKVFATGNVEYNEFNGIATQGQQDKGASLDKMTAETFLKIITGDSPISDFDVYVANWKKLGGDQITQEVNAWYDANKK